MAQRYADLEIGLRWVPEEQALDVGLRFVLSDTSVDNYFRRLIGDELVRGPTIITTSTHDRAVRVFYPLGAGARGDVAFDDAGLPVYGGIGTFGVRGSGIEIEDEQLNRVDEDYELRPGVVYNLNADTVIATSAGISGAHSDICHPEVARAVWRAAEGSHAGSMTS